jgi:rhomboid protease GluP
MPSVFHPTNRPVFILWEFDMSLQQWWSRMGDRMVPVLTVVNAGMFVLSILLNPFETSFDLHPFSLLAPDHKSLVLLGATGTIPIDRFHRWWSLVSAGYLHGGLLHLLFNMAALHQLGALILGGFGPARMMVIYTVGGIAGFLASYLAGIGLTIGASASLCALMGAGMYLGKSVGGYSGQTVFRQIGTWALGIFAFGFLVPGINNWGHAGGLIGGILVAAALRHRRLAPDNQAANLLGAFCATATGGILVYAVATSLMYRIYS